MVEEGAHFACIALRNVPAVFPNAERSVTISPTVTIVGRVPFEIDEFWRRELGKFFEDRVKESTLAIVATAPGATELDLSREARRVLCGLLLRGMPYIGGVGILLAGECRDGAVRVRGYTEHDRFLGLRGAPRADVGPDTMLEAGRIAAGLFELEKSATFESRFWAGFRSLYRGLQEWEPLVRVQDFVRALEALIVPEQGRTRGQFVERVKTFAMCSDEIAEEIYDLRTNAEHLHPWRRGMPEGLTEHEAEARSMLRTFQAETIALYAYRRIILHSDLRSLVSDEPRLRDFWTAPHDQRARKWGARVDANRIAMEGQWAALAAAKPRAVTLPGDEEEA